MSNLRKFRSQSIIDALEHLHAIQKQVRRHARIVLSWRSRQLLLMLLFLLVVNQQ